MDTDVKAFDFEKAFALLNEETKEHFRKTLITLLNCYLSDDMGGVLLVGNDTSDTIGFVTINASPMTAAKILDLGLKASIQFNTANAPPKEMFN
jgi:predicted dinucleotide-binding enzyme